MNNTSNSKETLHLVKISNYQIFCFSDMDQAVDYVYQHCLASACSAIAINPEKIISSSQDLELANIIESSELRYLDGIGACILASIRLKKRIARIPGCELWERVMERSVYEGKKVYLVGATKETVFETKQLLESKYGVNVVGYTDGYFSDERLLIDNIRNLSPDIVSVAMGSPKQERFIAACKAKGITSFLMGVGGTYDVFTGKVRRAPRVYRNLGMEWFYRLLCQPSRVIRQAKLINFIVLALRGKI
ncbi:WecB/TagA/CpsF family glycosyltransferase [Vibrio harveyi]|uniref:WecB/TagA/CpsF family glycosyltransferase n=1 Tax=Vibrio harveyi TaxID=669 RepID=UPI000680EB95|nr:WecB/TagA/CpsF family glycosyltransferase [Vibrio harveyi]WDZ72983.1 WecB/TagA/CpsF family glycosyltransferase [Vibrio harveyi]